MMKTKNKDIRKYACNYCGGYEFEQEIRTIRYNNNSKRGGSNQVKCPRCGNFLKNDEGKKK